MLASAGVAIGMALSGNLQNFAGGLIVLLLRPYKVGDLIESQGITGTVREIQIFHTILTTGDNKIIYIPNGALSSGTVTNYSREATRRVEWIIGVSMAKILIRWKKLPVVSLPKTSGFLVIRLLCRSSCTGCQ